MYSHRAIELVCGGGVFGFNIIKEKPAQEFIDLLTAQCIHRTDTANIYGESEALLGKLGAGRSLQLIPSIPEAL